MKFKAKRIRQIIIGIVSVLGLSVSSVAACACSHHGESPEPSHSCHQAAATVDPSTNNESIAVPAFDEVCVCVPQAVKLSVKSEGFKLKKHPATFRLRTVVRASDFWASAILLSDSPVSPSYRLQFSGAIFSRGPPTA